MATIEQNQVEQEEFEEAARGVVQDTKDYTDFRRYMTGACPDVRVCDSCMCPLDSRLNAKEVEDAKYACKLSAVEQDRQQEPVKTAPNVVGLRAYAARPCECGLPRRPKHKYCDRCAAIKIQERDRLKKRRKRAG